MFIERPVSGNLAMSDVGASRTEAGDRLDLIDDHKLISHPRIAGGVPTLSRSCLASMRRPELISAAPQFRARHSLLPHTLTELAQTGSRYPTVSYYQALDPSRYLPPDIFRDKTLLVGLSLKAAPSTDNGATDAFATPYTQQTGTLTAGIEVHATLLDNLRERLWISPAPPLAIAIAVVACALFGAGTGRAASSWRTGLLAALFLVPIMGASFVLLRLGRIWVPPVTPILAGSLAFGSRFALDYARERRARAAVSGAFSRYVTPALVEELARNPDALRLGGETRELTVLFCDVRGFTGLSECLKADPVRLMGIIYRLLDARSEQILAARGTIDKYMGDCVMAFWNAPLREPDPCRCGRGCRRADGRGRRGPERRPAGRGPLASSAGRRRRHHTGICVVGNIGSRWRYDYSVLGDAVNLASRLEGLTKEYRVPIVVGEGTALAITDRFSVKEIDRIAVRGRREATPIFSVMRVT